jgi:chemotaxis protein histidine kinase CheA
MEESTEHAMQVDYEQEKRAMVVGRKATKAGRKKSTGESIGLVQARIEAFLNLSGEAVVNKGRLPKRKWGKVGENMDLASKKQKKK